MTKIILISGKAQHGKNETARIMTNIFENQGYKCLTMAYGDYLKFCCSQYFGWNGVKDDAGRTILQVKGTEEGRDRNPDIWVNVVIEFLKTFAEDYDFIFLPDFRYPNEYSRIEQHGFSTVTIRVKRGCEDDFDNGLNEEQKNHRSETSLDYFDFDFYLYPEAFSIPSLESEVNRMLRYGHDYFLQRSYR